jgi:hypothetical protein
MAATAPLKEHHAYYPEGVGACIEKPAELKPAIERAATAVQDGRTAILNVLLER